MNKELIDKIRCILDFMEKADALACEERRKGEAEREEHLLAGLSNAERDIRKYISLLLGDEQDDDAPATGKEPAF
jgi:hypothetical protein